MTAAIYARFSSDLQDAKSIDDQVAACRTFAERGGIGGPFVVYADQALSGASMATRAQLQALLADVKARRVKVVVSEALDRLSRDQADVALIHRAVKFAGGKILTISEGEIDVLHIGLKGTMNHLFLEELGRKTRRGQIGVARSGRIAGGRCYGYAPVPGQPGARVIAEEEAAVIRRIYAAYVEGQAPRAIAKALNHEGVAPPRGDVWRNSTLLGDASAFDGILCQELYRGRIVFNRRRFVKDPETGRRHAVLNPEADWIITQAPQLRIVEERLWLAAQARRASVRGLAFAGARRRRPKRLLSGLLRCGCCGGPVSIVGAESLGCSNVRQAGTCDQRATIAPRKVETRVVEGLKRFLLAPDLVHEALTAFREERAKLRQQENRRRLEVERDLEEAQRRAHRIAEQLIEAGGATLRNKLAEAEARIAALTAERQALSPAPVVEMHPNAADLYRARVADLETALSAPDGAQDGAALRALIAYIDLAPDAAEPQGWRITIHGDLAAILALGVNEKAPSVSAGGLPLIDLRESQPSEWVGAGAHTLPFRGSTLPLVA